MVANAPALASQAPERARVTLGTLELPTYREGIPDPNPPFDAFRPQRINYPYTLRTNLSDDRSMKPWRAVFLENEYLRCSVLPDLGGHLYSCTDKISGQEMFYANPSIKLTQIGYRGAWAAFGVEFNFPVSHNWMSTSPVDFAYREQPDGSASVWVGNIDRVYGTDWRVELTLRPGRAVLEQHTSLYNRSNTRHRYYWWTNAAVEVTDESWVLYPMRTTASHGFTELDSWPVDRAGTDNSRVGNHLFGPVSRFSHGSREPFMAVYHPDSQFGVMHYSAPDHLPSKKIWSWGGDERGIDWRRALSDDSSAYVEIQAGVFRNQETYGYLEPQERLSFSEFWTPLRALGGMSRANPDVQIHMCRMDACGRLPSPGLEHVGSGALRIRANVTQHFPATTLTVLRGNAVGYEERVDLDPWTPLDRTFDEFTGNQPFTVRVVGSDGAVLIEHTEGEYDYAPVDDLGAQETWSVPSPDQRTESDVLHHIDALERDGRRHEAWAASQRALERFPTHLALSRAAGRLAVVLRRFEDGIELLDPVIERVSNDAEAQYYLALAHMGLDRPSAAQVGFEAALHDTRYRGAARLQLGLLAAARDDMEGAADHLMAGLEAQPLAPRTIALLSAVLRWSDKEGDALSLLDRALSDFPSHSFLRYEASRLGAHDPSLWSHLAGDPERVLEIAADYLVAGQYDEALRLLERDWEEVEGEGVEREPGQVGPSLYPIVAYTRAHARAQSGQPYVSVLDEAAALPLRGVFANRSTSKRALEWAASERSSDAAVHWLLGGLALQSANFDAARHHWELAREQRSDIPALHRSLGLLLMEQEENDRAIDVLSEGTQADPTNIGVYLALDDALGQAQADPSARADALLSFPDHDAMPAALVYRTARRLAQAQRFDEADALFADRFFPREEGGINVRQVYLEVRLGRARAEAEAGDCRESGRIMRDLLTADPQLEFTADGLELWLDRGDLRPAYDEVVSLCATQEGNG